MGSCRFFALLVGLLLVAASGCGEKVDHVFDIELAPPKADGRPVIAVKSNGKEMPRGTGPFGSYMLLLRKNGEDYYVRTFEKEQAIRGVRIDLAVGGLVDEKDHLTVAVENLIPNTNKKTIRLSNRLAVPPIPKTAKNLTVPIPGRASEAKP